MKLNEYLGKLVYDNFNGVIGVVISVEPQQDNATKFIVEWEVKEDQSFFSTYDMAWLGGNRYAYERYMIDRMIKNVKHFQV